MRRSIAYLLVFFTTIACLLVVGTCTTPVSDKPDTNPPNQITQIFFYQVLPTAVELGWVAPADDRGDSVKLYDCRYSRDSLTSANWENAEPVNNLPTPGHSGAYQRVMLTNLDSLDAYYFAIRSMDKAGNYSLLSKVIKKLALPLDTFAPTPITNFSVIRRDTFVLQFSWSAPDEHGGQAATRYEIRYDTATITEQNWLGAALAAAPPIPSVPGVMDSFLLIGLLPATKYYCVIRSADLLGNTSALSNIAQARTLDTLTSDTIPTETDSLAITSSREFGGYTFVSSRAVSPDGLGNIVVAGLAKEGSASNDYYLAKLNDSGSIIWEKKFGTGESEFLTDVALTTTGFIVAIGGSTNSSAVMYWCNQNGDILKTKTIDSSQSGNAKIAATPDGGVVVLTGFHVSHGSYGDEPVLRVVKFNVLGEQEWIYVLNGGTRCVHWDGDYFLPSAYAGETRVADSLIFVSWMGEESSGIGIGGCGPPAVRSIVSVFSIAGTRLHEGWLDDVYMYLYYPVPTSLAVDEVSVASNRFHCFGLENEGYKLYQCDLQCNVLAEHPVTFPAFTMGILRIYIDAFLVYGSGNSGAASDKLLIAVIDELGITHQQFVMPTDGASTAYDALLLPNGSVIVIGEQGTVDNSAGRGLFLHCRPQ